MYLYLLKTIDASIENGKSKVEHYPRFSTTPFQPEYGPTINHLEPCCLPSYYGRLKGEFDKCHLVTIFDHARSSETVVSRGFAIYSSEPSGSILPVPMSSTYVRAKRSQGIC